MEEKLDMQSPNWAHKNSQFIAEKFPNCITETAEGIKVDFDLLKQELSADIIEGNKERYRLEWPGKREAIVTANLPTTKTLRPVREDSVDFDNTENLYIEGDNLEVLKLLQESYLGKIKIIYLDPPYNTGNDFVYVDDFKKLAKESDLESGLIDEEGRKLSGLKDNPAAAGRYHSDWLSMMYPRLKLGRNLLTEDGVIFISIDDNEVSNLKKVCDEIFGENNFIDIFSWVKSETPANLSYKTKKAIEYVIAYQKNKDNQKFTGLKRDSKSSNGLMNKTNPINKLIFPKNVVDTGLNDGVYRKGEYGTSSYKIILLEDTEVKDGLFIREVILTGNFKWTQPKLINEISNGTKMSIRTISFSPSYEKQEYEPEVPWNLISRKFDVETNESAGKKLKNLFDNKKIFDYPKPTSLLKYIFNFCLRENDIVFDFFAGSSSSAHAIMEMNSLNNGKRRFILNQLQEKTDKKSEAYLSGYNNICEIGKERIRKASKKIMEETGAYIDYGFRVYRLDESNMQDVYYKPQEYKQGQLDLLSDNVKADRTADDLLAQVMLDWGLPLSLKIEQARINGKKVFKVAENSLFACFDNGIDEAFAKAIAKEAPLRIVFKDRGFKDDTAKVNVKQLLKQLSPETEMKVL